jgi:hypothetical protein
MYKFENQDRLVGNVGRLTPYASELKVILNKFRFSDSLAGVKAGE